MSVGSVHSALMGYPYTADTRKADKAASAPKAAETENVSPEDMTLGGYMAYFQEKLDGLYRHPSQKNINEVIVITDAAYERMKTDPEYEAKVLNAFAVNWAVDFGKYIPKLSVMHIDDTWGKSYGYTRGMKDNTPADDQLSEGGAAWWQERHERYEELLDKLIEESQKVDRDQNARIRRASLAASAYEDAVSTFSESFRDIQMKTRNRTL